MTALRFKPPKLEPALWLSLRGRVSRSTYWLYFIVPVTAIVVLAASLDAITGASPTNVIAEAYRSTFGDTFLSMSAFAGPISNVALVAYFWPLTAGSVKRLHDLSVSGWAWVVYLMGSLGAWGFFLMSSPSVLSVALVILATLGGLVMNVFVYFVPGTPGQSKYGPDPLGRPEAVGQ